MNLISKKSNDLTTYTVTCTDSSDLSTENILFTIAAMKGKLLYDIAMMPRRRTVQCKMTAIVRAHITEAVRKCKMYGKNPSPIIPSFDEYGNRLPDKLQLGESNRCKHRYN